MSPLLFAVRDGNTEVTRLLLELGADIKQTPAITPRPLLIAMLNGQVAMAMDLPREGRGSESG
jgi:ankyrin repeat protein